MRNFAVLLLKEERALFSSPIAYVLVTVFLLIMGYSFTLTLFLSHQPSLVHIFFQMFRGKPAPADTNYGDGRTRGHSRRVDHRTDTGQHCAAEQGCMIERHAAVDLDQ